MIRDWEQITADNINDTVPGCSSKVGRAWLANCAMNGNDAEDNIQGIRHVVSLSPCMDTKYGCIPKSLVSNCRFLGVYIEAGGKFENFFTLLDVYLVPAYVYDDTKKGIELILSHGAQLPMGKLANFPDWIGEIMTRFWHRRQNCTAVCILLLALGKRPRSRSPLVCVAERDVLGLIVARVWATRSSSEKWEQ